MRRTKRTLVFNTRLVEHRQHRIDVTDWDEDRVPSAEDLARGEVLSGFLYDNADDDDWDTVREDDETFADEYRVEEEDYDDGETADEARYSANEDAIREDMAAGVRDDRGRLL